MNKNIKNLINALNDLSNMNKENLIILTSLQDNYIKKLSKIIDKAIEYINEHKHLSLFADCTEPEEDWTYDLEIEANELLDILKGSDKE